MAKRKRNYIKDLDEFLEEMTYHTEQMVKAQDKFQRRHPPKPETREMIDNKPLNKKQMSQLKESLLKCRVQGNTVYLPPISEGVLPNYADVRKALLNAGAKYKRNTFVFQGDAQPYVDRLTGGESVNIKKEFQFFATPPTLVKELIFLAKIQPLDKILEPSAGNGAIVDEIRRGYKNDIECCELMPENAHILMKKGYDVIRNDFFEITDRKNHYDKIIANPPFNKNKDIDHIRKMYECLKPGGRIVTIASNHWQLSSNKKEKEFKAWLEELEADIIPIEAGEFKESGTSVATCIIIINK